MKIIGYGEDALTLWALLNRLQDILHAIGDPSRGEDCKVLYRPSFGRRGGERSAQFGEFDFILLSKDSLYLGESKWDRSPELSDEGMVELRSEQLLRHRVFQFYVDEWAYGKYSSWEEFVAEASKKRIALGLRKPLALPGSLLAKNLCTVLGIISDHFAAKPRVQNVLLYLYDSSRGGPPPERIAGDFSLVVIDYSQDAFDNFIAIET